MTAVGTTTSYRERQSAVDRVVVSNDPETHEGGGVCDKPRHLCVGDLVDEVLV